jgi:hypothetical protein
MINVIEAEKENGRTVLCFLFATCRCARNINFNTLISYQAKVMPSLQQKIKVIANILFYLIMSSQALFQETAFGTQ